MKRASSYKMHAEYVYLSKNVRTVRAADKANAGPVRPSAVDQKVARRPSS